MAEVTLSCHGVSLERGGRLILEEVNWACRGGQMTLLQGATGAGKSTLLALLAAVHRPSAGEVRACGAPISRWGVRHRDAWRRDLAWVPQRLALVESRSALENVMLGVLPDRMGWGEMVAQSREVLASLGCGHLADREVGLLSMGERQRVVVARALVREARYVLADEPTAHQDSSAAEGIMAALCARAAQGAVVVVVSHDPRWDGVASERWRLAGGRVEALEAGCCNTP